MGVSIREVLQSKFFKDYYVIAGENGLNRETQAVVLFDAPDGYKWFKGKELVLTTGFFFKDNTKLFKNVISFLHSKNSAAMAIKKDRYLNEIPEEILNLCNDLDFPLVIVPYNVAWIDIINAVNSIVVNRYITRLNDANFIKKNVASNDFYKKIENIIINLSKELNSPISVRDIIDKNIINYPKNYKSEEELDNLSENILFNYQKEVLCDKLNICRITNMEDKKSWIEMIIKINSTPVTKIIVWEEHRSIDYYDLFALRLTYTLLLEIYEQIYVMNSFERKFYDDLIKSLFDEMFDTKEKLVKVIKGMQNFKLNIDNKFICIIIRQEEKNPSFYTIREKIYNTLLLRIPKDEAIFGIIDDNTVAIIKDISKYNNNIIINVQKELNDLLINIESTFIVNELKIGIGNVTDDICFINGSYIEALRAIEVGNYIYPKKKIISFEELGPFGLLRLDNIHKKSFGRSFNNLYPLLKEGFNEELLTTLKVYLESESNCNIAAQKLYIHSNSVRYRIAKVQQLCNIDLEDPIERLKTEITLNFIELFK